MAKKGNNSSKKTSTKEVTNEQAEVIVDTYAQDNAFEVINSSVLSSREFEIKVKTDIVKSVLANVTNALNRTLSNSIIISGPSGSGKTTFLDFVADTILKVENNWNYSISTEVIQLFSEDMPETSEEIIESLSSIIEMAKEKNKVSVLFLLDDLWLFSTAFLTEFSYIYEGLKTRTNLKALKFISTINENVLEQVGNKWEIVANSFITTIVPEKNPEIICEMLYPDVEKIYIASSADMLGKTVEMTDELSTALRNFTSYAWVAFAAKASFDSEEYMYNYNSFIHFMDGVIGRIPEKWHLVGYEKDCLLNINSVDFENYHSYSIEKRNAIIRHESGHCLIALINSDIFSVDGVCCLPDTEHKISGVTLAQQWCGGFDKNSVIRGLAFYLAGRIAQGEPYSTTASNDLSLANELANEFVEKYGAYESIGINVFLYGKTSISKDKLRAVEKEVINLLAEAEKYAKKMLKTHKKLFDALCSRLQAYPIITSKELAMLKSKFEK